MLLFVCMLFSMPPNPYTDIDHLIRQPKFPALMNAPMKRVEQPVGEKKALILLIDFNDNAYTYSANEFDSLIYGENQNSLRDYYSEVSYGKFTISKDSDISQWLRAPNNYSYYIGDSFGIYPGNYPNNVQGIVIAACSLADSLIDFSQYDEDADGVVDAIFIVHAGPGAEETGNINYVWSHQWQLSQRQVSQTLQTPARSWQTSNGSPIRVSRKDATRQQTTSSVQATTSPANRWPHSCAVSPSTRSWTQRPP